MSKLRYKIANAKLLQKASAVRFGWLAMEKDGRWYWYSKKPEWTGKAGWWAKYGSLENVRFLKLAKRKPYFAPLSLIKCTARGPILLSTGNQYHRTWGMISVETAKNLRRASK